MPPDEPNDEEELEALPDDYETPFSIPAEGPEYIAGSGDAFYMTGRLDATHPATDSGLELQELYDEGLSGAAEASEPNAADTVIGYRSSRVRHKQRDRSAAGTVERRRTTQQQPQRAQATWKSMTHRQRTLVQPEGQSRAKPGMAGGGKYFRIVVRPKSEFVAFRYHDIGQRGHLQRLAGRRSSGSWATQAWLINKADAHLTKNILVADTKDVRDLLMQLGSEPKHEKGDIFSAKDRRTVSEREKPISLQRRARPTNIQKAQASHMQKPLPRTGSRGTGS